ncbi:ATP-dependent HslUV protease ATP-binding subunit HslU [Marinococcus luteus]|jgi:ATP-dependent HslUV protease ATP-binding subunit HslU|uniref:ATP-dependent protease ATPase subunit HslU n=1 Tax=Marinococcus luteus TaxID=1122204 RepID=A0A1H2QBH7_9BACI|nr:ATP-dependent protease ATPase subunit HslU [Marinococcus luteus]SDW04516.1 ATP-dependent HslUV protease ATP-binding subunit HslU [Marinococcus luteus]
MEISMTPKQIVERLDQYIIGQNEAKRSVAVALRNRYRRSKLPEQLQEEVTPKNILMIGPTGVGKTEIARRIAKLVGAPFSKVEATKFTEVGYVGRDVESMIRDLVEVAVRIVKEEKTASVQEKAEKAANKKIVRLLAPRKRKNRQADNNTGNPFGMLFQQNDDNDEEEETDAPDNSDLREQRRQLQKQLEMGELEDRKVTIEVEQQSGSMGDMFQGGGMEQMGMNMQEMLGNMMPKKSSSRTLPVREARKVLTEQEAQKMIDMDEVSTEAVYRAEQLGIVFLDEIDKVTGKKESSSADVSREGVQRDILPIVEGSTVNTKYGPVRTDHMLFIAAGAFHTAKPSDLIPELQGRFPVRVELDNLGAADFARILREPDQALTKQYQALIRTEGIEVTFTDEAVDTIAELAEAVNQQTENIGARRLHTLLERLLEDLSFEAPEITMDAITITPEYVNDKLATIARDRDVSRYIL